jgi:hypothetical protein
MLGETEHFAHPTPATDNLLGATAVGHELTLAMPDTSGFVPDAAFTCAERLLHC